MIFDESFPTDIRPTEEEVIMKTNAHIINSLSEALGNVESGDDANLLLEQLQKHSNLLISYSEKLIQSQRLNIKAVN